VSRLNNSSRGSLLCYVTDRRSLAATENTRCTGNSLAEDRSRRRCRRRLDSNSRERIFREETADGSHAKPSAGSQKAQSSDAVAVRILVNDRVDVALSERTAGVHLRENSLPLPEAKRLASARAEARDFLIGVSCHSLEARNPLLVKERITCFWPCLRHSSKRLSARRKALKPLAEVCRAASTPVLAIGGITVANAVPVSLPARRDRGHSPLPGCAGHARACPLPAKAGVLINAPSAAAETGSAPHDRYRGTPRRRSGALLLRPAACAILWPPPRARPMRLLQ